jgi:hypothetical protein
MGSLGCSIPGTFKDCGSAAIFVNPSRPIKSVYTVLLTIVIKTLLSLLVPKRFNLKKIEIIFLKHSGE